MDNDRPNAVVMHLDASSVSSPVASDIGDGGNGNGNGRGIEFAHLMVSSSHRGSSSGTSLQLPASPASSPSPSPSSDSFQSDSNLTQEQLDDLQDAKVLEKLGYKQDLYRGFTAFMNFSFCMTSVAVVSSITLGFSNSLAAGGPGILSVAWLVCSFFTILIGASMAEICSAYPSAGSVYHWAGMLASERWAPLWSYVSGWFNFMGNAAGDAAYAFGFAQVVSAAVDLHDYNNYVNKYNAWYASLDPNTYGNPDNCLSSPVNTTLAVGPVDSAGNQLSWTSNHMSVGAQVALSIGAAAVWAIKNVARIDKQGWLNNFSSLWQMITTVIIIIVLLAKAPSLNPGKWVFGDFEDNAGFDPPNAPGGPNGTQFNDFAYLCFVGLLNALFSQSGYEAGGHMAEETKGAVRTAPNGILYTCIATCCCGFIYIIAILATIPSSKGTLLIRDPVCQVNPCSLDNSNECAGYSNPVFGTMYYVVGYHGGMVLACMVIVDMFFAGFSSLTVTTRIGYAMARDGAFPGSNTLKYIWPSTKTPIFIILLVFVLDSLLVLFVLVTMNDPNASGPVAFTAVTSITVVGYQISYAIPILMRSIFRRNDFALPQWNLGRFGVPIGLVSGFWLIATSIIMFWPNAWPITQYTFNYTIAVVGGTMLVAAFFWVVSARHTFTGPARGEVAKSLA